MFKHSTIVEWSLHIIKCLLPLLTPVTLVISPSVFSKIILNASTDALVIDHVHRASDIIVIFYKCKTILYHGFNKK